MAVIGIEVISIFGNILKMKGYDLNFNKVVEIIISKRFDIDQSKLEGVITKSEDKK